MYFSKTDNIIYLPNSIEKLFIEPNFVDHVTKEGTKRYDFTGDWLVEQIEIKLDDSEFILPFEISNGPQRFLLDPNQNIVQGQTKAIAVAPKGLKAKTVFENFKIIKDVGVVTILPFWVTLKPNDFFKLLKIVQSWSTVKFETVTTSSYVPPTITDVNLKHCRLIYFQSQRTTL